MSTQNTTSNTAANPKNQILVVDDEIGPRESLKMILSPDYNVVTAENGQEGIDKFDSSVPDLAIIDIRMPVMNGVDLMKAIRERSPETPIIILTGYGTLESAQEAVRLGAYDYISKPYDVETLRGKVQEALDNLHQKQEQREKIERLRTMNTQLEEQVKELDRKSSIGELSAEMVHDLNNPITVLRGYITLLEGSMEKENEEMDNEEQNEFIEVIKKQTERCMRLTRNFLDYARNSNKKWSKGNVNDIIRDSIFVLRVRMKKLGISLETNMDQQIPPIQLQETPLQQVIYNLTSNAVDAMEEHNGTRILSVSTKLLDPEENNGYKYVEINVKDTGPGISEDVQQKIFEPFFTTKGKNKGTGLGLPICKRVTEEHGGSLELDSEVGRGTCFRITLPAVESDEPPTDDEDEQQEQE